MGVTKAVGFGNFIAFNARTVYNRYMNKKTITIIFFIIFFLLLAGYLYQTNIKGKKEVHDTQKQTNIKISKTAKKDPYMLEGYPLETVPLYKLNTISSFKFFVNIDPSRSEDYFGKKVNYYNVVYKTDSKANETLSYYSGLMKEKNTKGVSDSQVEGLIGKYKVSVSQYEYEDVYVQVHLPTQDLGETNPYYTDYPKIVELLDEKNAYETSYGLLNQKGGEIEYTQYFPLPKEEKEIDTLISQFEDKYSSETDFVYDEKSNMMTWKKNGYAVTLTFSKGHGRIYLMMRTPMSQS